MPALRIKRIAATTSKNMGQPNGTNTGLNAISSKKPASAAQSKNIRIERADSVAAATEAMGAPFDAACKGLHDQGRPEVVYEVIAKRIVNAAKKGARDVDRLRDAGLAALGLSSDREIA
jgi:hypothetical protein